MVRSSVLASGLFLAASLAASLSLPAQVTPATSGAGPDGPATPAAVTAPPQPSSTLLIRLRSTRLALDQAADLAAELKTRKIRDRLQASKILRDHYLRQQKEFDKAQAQSLLSFEKVAKKAQKNLLGKKGTAEVATLRAQSLAVSRQSSLTKAQIQESVDPCMAKLGALLRPQLADVLKLDPKLHAAIVDLRTRHAELRQWFTLYASMSEGLELYEDAARHFVKYPVPPSPGDEQRIDQAIEFAMFAGLPMSSGDRSALDANEQVRSRAPHQEYLGTLELNQIRYLLGLGLVRIDEKLSDAARDHSADMHRLKFFAHKSPVPGKTNFGQRAANFGTSARAENIAAGQRTGHGAIRAWWYSPGHHRNMLGGHRRTGLGQHEKMWTQMFGG